MYANALKKGILMPLKLRYRRKKISDVIIT